MCTQTLPILKYKVPSLLDRSAYKHCHLMVKMNAIVYQSLAYYDL